MKKIFHNDIIINRKSVFIDPCSTGFQYGNGFFTTIRCVDYHIEFIEDHIKRIKDSCKFFNLSFRNYDYQKIITDLLKINKFTLARVKIIVYEDQNTNYLIIPYEIQSKKNPQPLELEFSRQKRGNLEIHKYKSLNYYQNFSQMKRNNSGKRILNLDCYNNVLETATSNIFFLRKNEIVTPSANLPILSGIIRKKILNLKKIAEYSVKEAVIGSEEIENFDCAFLTNSIKKIEIVQKVGNHCFDWESYLSVLHKLDSKLGLKTKNNQKQDSSSLRW